jgi:hypothetical protein
MFTVLSAFAPAADINAENVDLHLGLIANRLSAALESLPESEGSPLMPRWELGLAKEVVSIRVEYVQNDKANEYL